MIDSIVTLFIAAFVAIAVYGHVLVAQALLGPKFHATPVQERAAPTVLRAIAVIADDPRTGEKVMIDPVADAAGVQHDFVVRARSLADFKIDAVSR